METLGKDVIGLILEQMTPTDWWCTSLVCKKWWIPISKWLSLRKTLFQKRLKETIDLYHINLIEYKNRFCIIPLYHLQIVGTGCKGNIKNFTCARHRNLSLSSRELCENCLENPVSSNCLGNRCNSMKCRDYMYILRDGEAVKVKSYKCREPNCDKPTDSNTGHCYYHAIEIYPQKEEHKSQKYDCTCKTKKGTPCNIKTSSRISKCFHHSFSPTSLV